MYTTVLDSWLGADGAQVLNGNHENLGFVAPPAVTRTTSGRIPDIANPTFAYRAQTIRLYRAYFDRPPDGAGWEYWSREFASGSSLADISYSFAASSEFNRTATLSDEEFVTFVYAEVLDREPDAEGFAYWLAQLAGDTDRGELVLYFSESVEYVTRTAEVMTGECWQGSVVDSYRCWAETLPAYSW